MTVAITEKCHFKSPSISKLFLVSPLSAYLLLFWDCNEKANISLSVSNKKVESGHWVQYKDYRCSHIKGWQAFCHCAKGTTFGLLILFGNLAACAIAEATAQKKLENLCKMYIFYISVLNVYRSEKWDTLFIWKKGLLALILCCKQMFSSCFIQYTLTWSIPSFTLRK